MDTRWDLSILYDSVKGEKYKSDLELLKSTISIYSKWVDDGMEKTVEETLIKFLEFTTKIEELAYTLGAFPSLSTAVNTKDTESKNALEMLDQIFLELTKPSVNFKKWLQSNRDEVVKALESKSLADSKFYFNEMLNSTKYMLSDKEEIVYATLQNTGSSAWSKLHNLLTSTLKVDYRDEIISLPVVRNLAYDKDPKVRKDAYEAELKSYLKIEDSIASALNAIKGEVIEDVKLRGYDSPLDKTLQNSRMDKETLDAMISSIEDYLPKFEEYYKKKAEMLGHKNGLPFYDLFAPMGESNKTFTYEEAANFVVENFRSFSDELADYADHAFKNRWIDAEPKEGKVGGAFCYGIHPVGESRILSNFTGSLSDVLTLAHELGHGFHGHCLKSEKIINCDYPMPVAETASIFCETIVNNAMMKTADRDSLVTILESGVSDAGQVIVDIYSRYTFETNLFENRKKGSLSVDHLKELMTEAQKKAYRKGLDHNYLHPYMWINKGHYYGAGNNFYNFPYAFGLLFAKGLYAIYLERGESFVNDYKNLLAATGKNSIKDVAMLMDIDITKKDFWKGSLELIAKDIDKFLAL
ncbi:MAG: oligoendopeptidase F [Candidatus Cloacimonadota bacterium]|nr:MAG: oligoendopeptidase F [Candidatus Cloacimonadota bacterium]PIE77734.1 MAG: oligoendopeptidase F [Candidatus Delongbacteria bacterium]